MSFEFGFYKDILLNKLGAAKDRAAAVLKQLDNCDVRMKIVNANTRDDIGNMPVFRSRSKSKCKHYYSHEEERFHSPRYYEDWSSDNEYGSDCSCSDHATVGAIGRGRRSHRDGDTYVDGGSAEQQNILIKGCCRGKCKHVHHRPPRSRSVIVVDQPRHWRRRPCHPEGHCCIHGLGYFDVCSRCPAVGRLWEPRCHFASQREQQNIHRIVDDDGKMNFYDSTKLSKFLCDQAQAYAKSEADKKAIQEKQMADALGAIKKMCNPTPNILGGLGMTGAPGIMGSGMIGRGCGCDGYLHNCGIYNGSRSAQEIENDLAQVNADLAQLHARALLDAQAQALANFDVEDLAEDMAKCSGALQEDSDDVQRIRKQVGDLRQKPLKSILAAPKLKKVNFADNAKCSASRIEEIAEGDGLSLADNPDCYCARCA